MSKIALKPNASGTGVFSLEAPNSNTDRTLTLPDEVGKFLTDSGALNVDPSAPTQSATIDSNGNLLVGTTFGDSNLTGAFLRPDGFISATRSNNRPMYLTRNGSDGEIIQFRKDNSKTGEISVVSGSLSLVSESALAFGSESSRFMFMSEDQGVGLGCFTSRDNQLDLGRSTARFDDIYATNGTIQTSDINEKQDVEELSDTEARVAAKAKTLLRKYRWKSAVEERGDEARIHFGIIAQDLEQAFIDEGLDAGRYGMFIRGEWYEAEVEKTRTVENDDGTETTETYMATETYDTAEEAPSDAVHKERLGVRYHELLAFIIAAI